MQFPPVILQGIVLISPAVDAQRSLLLNVLQLLQYIALMVCPRARIVPSPPFEDCTNVPELVSVHLIDARQDAFVPVLVSVCDISVRVYVLCLQVLMISGCC